MIRVSYRSDRFLARVLPRSFQSDLRLYQHLSNKPWWRLMVQSEGLWVLVLFRLIQALDASPLNRNVRRVIGIPLRITYRLMCMFVGIALPTKTRLAPGLHISHGGAIVIHPEAVIGPHCFITHQVTLGIAGNDERRGVPTVGRGVYIGAGAKIIGKVTIGDYAKIGANAVVTKDIPSKAVAVGVPATVIGYQEPDPVLLAEA